MRDLFIALGVPLAVLAAALAPVYLASDNVEPGYEEHARRLRTQASHWSDIRPGWPRIVELEPLAGPDSPDAVGGTVEWLGPFAVPVLEVAVGPRSGDSERHSWPAALAWGAPPGRRPGATGLHPLEEHPHMTTSPRSPKVLSPNSS